MLGIVLIIPERGESEKRTLKMGGPGSLRKALSRTGLLE